MQPTSNNASTRRRQRLSSSASSNSSPASPPGIASKRPRFTENNNNTAMAMSARARGKLPETANLSQRQASSAFQPLSGAKKLVIQNLRALDAHDADAEEYYARCQKDLGSALAAVFSGGRPSAPFERLYRAVEDLCRKGMAETVYKMLAERIGAHLSNVVLPRIKGSGESRSNTEMLETVLGEWRLWTAQLVTIRSTFSYLDRTYLLRAGLPSINDLAIANFRRMAFSTKNLSSDTNRTPGAQVVAGICDMIEYDRRGDSRLQPPLLKDGIRMLYILGVYVKHLELPLLQQSAAYFTEFGDLWSASSLKDYIAACEALLQRENHRCFAYNIESTTEKQLMASVHDILVQKYSDKLLDSGSLSHLLSEMDVKSVKCLFDLLRLSGIQSKMKGPWGGYIRATGASIISDKERGSEMVLRLLELRRSLDLMIRDALANDDVFYKEMRAAFDDFMNDSQAAACWDSGTSKIGEMLSKYIDMLLRGGLKALPKNLLSDAKDRAAAEKQGQSSTADEEAELDRQLDQVLELFRSIKGSDAFEAFYKKDLARRLLMGRSASNDAERSMLTRLRNQCGSSFTHNLEQMFKDQELAKEEMESYKLWRESSYAGSEAVVDLNVMILSAAAWPTYPDVRLNMPDEVATQIERFDGYYRNKHTGRILTWKHALGHCSVKANFPRGTKELLVSASQAVVLLAFNTVPDDGFLTYQETSTATGLGGGELERTLQSLACGKARVLTKHPKGRDVNATDTFAFNRGFVDAKYRVKINQIQLKETKEENRATHERIVQDRRFETQAAIARIMKSRKHMGHADLVAEVIGMTRKRGSVEPGAIKKEIESLIEKDYLERDDTGYTYLA